MPCRIEYTPQAAKELERLDRPAAYRIIQFLDERVIPCDDPRAIGQALHSKLGQYWKYRVGDCRVICEIKDKAVEIIVVSVGNRRDVYR